MEGFFNKMDVVHQFNGYWLHQIRERLLTQMTLMYRDLMKILHRDLLRLGRIDGD